MDPAAAGYQGRIAFIADGDVWVAQADGGGPTNLTNSPGPPRRSATRRGRPDLDPATAGYQGRIAFASTAQRMPGCPANEDIYTIAATGGASCASPRNRTAIVSRLVARRDADRLLDQPGEHALPGGSVCTSWVTGDNETKIPARTPDDVGTNAAFPNWSPTGRGSW